LEATKKKSYLKISSVIKIAASVALILSIASLSYYFITDNKNDAVLNHEIENYTETKLIIDNGEELNIKSEQSEIIYSNQGQDIRINNKVIKNNNIKGKSNLNQLIVPFGKQSKILLADGTTVWLNAGSQLSYPAKFSGSKREVFLLGEAFFDVKSDEKHPFVVVISDMIIKVTGTKFNVTSYPGDPISQTVLLSGKVSAKPNKRFANEIYLEPGERIVYKKSDHEMVKEKVDAKIFASWVNGYLIFNDEALTEVIKKLERFYNEKIIITGSKTPAMFTGKLDLADSLDQVLANISFSVPFSKEKVDNTIIIKIKP
jgi:hypothetical protein